MNITVVVIAKNAESLIVDCLKSVAWANEIILIDTHSTDKTGTIAKNLGAKVYTSEFNGYGKLREEALTHITSDWIFYLDTDERIEQGLQVELEKVINENKYSAISLPRKNIMLGHWFRYGGWYPDYQTRIFKREALSGWRGTLHETPLFNGKEGFLMYGLIHLTSKSIDGMLRKTEVWSKEEARLLFEAGHPPMNNWRFGSALVRCFYNRMIKGQAFRDGTVGVLMAFYQVFSTFLSYARLWELQHAREIKEKYENESIGDAR